MADYVVVPANVLLGASGTQTRDGIAGATITAGQALYKDAADSNKLKLTDANSVTAAARVLEGIALNGAAVNQPVQYVLKDPAFGPGIASLPAGDVVILSDTPGGLCPEADAVTGDYVTVVGVAGASNKLNLTGTFISAGVAKA